MTKKSWRHDRERKFAPGPADATLPPNGPRPATGRSDYAVRTALVLNILVRLEVRFGGETVAITAALDRPADALAGGSIAALRAEPDLLALRVLSEVAGTICMINICIVVPRDGVCFGQTDCRLYMSKSGSRALICRNRSCVDRSGSRRERFSTSIANQTMPRRVSHALTRICASSCNGGSPSTIASS